MTSRHEFTLAVLAAVSCLNVAASAQTYPIRPITVIVPYAAGGGTDVIARLLAERMRGTLGQPMVIENVGGADGSIGVGRAARAKADGYSIDLGALTTHVLNGAFYSLQYDLLNDFAPISPLAANPYIAFGRKSLPVNNPQELIVWVKSHPSTVSTGVYSTGSRLVTALFQKETGTQLNLVPYRGAAPTMQDLVAAQIDLMFGTPDQLAFMRAGNVSAFAVAGSARLSVAPEIATFGEISLPRLSLLTSYGLFAPKGTPREIIGKLNAAVVDALADPLVRSRLADLGFTIFPREQQTPEALDALVKSGAEKWWPIIKQLGIKAE
jgi:tripartite-type tricarboxylate transporter receptor subunit TctC